MAEWQRTSTANGWTPLAQDAGGADEPSREAYRLDREVDPASPVPLYHQVYHAVLDAIRRGRFRVGDALPTEAELCELFGVSRITIRQALADLVQANHLARERSRGPLIVKSSPIVQQLARLPSFFTEDALAQGLEPRFVLREASRVRAAEQASVLELRVDDNVIKIDRLLVDQHGPLAILTSVIPEQRCPDLLQQDLRGSLLTLIETRYGLRFAQAVQWLSARTVSEGEARLFKLPLRTAVVVIKRLTRTADDLPVEYLECVLRADRYDFVMELRRD